MKLAHGRSGFTILEVLVAMAILLFGMTTILGLLTYGTALSKTAHLRTSAASAVQSVVADLEEGFFPEESGEAGEPTEIVDRPIAGVDGLVYSAKARPNPARPNEYRVDVAMSWSSQGVKREKKFTTILLREIPFGERLRRRASPGAGAASASATPKTTAPTARAPGADDPTRAQTPPGAAPR